MLFEFALFDVVFGCRPDQGRNTRRNIANASIVSQRLRYQRRFYLRPKFRQLQRLLGPAYPKSATLKLTLRVTILFVSAQHTFRIQKQYEYNGH